MLLIYILNLVMYTALFLNDKQAIKKSLVSNDIEKKTWG